MGVLNEPWDSESSRLRKLRERHQAMTEEELLEYGRSCPRLAANPRVSWEPDPWVERLREARRNGGVGIRGD
jgi:hypothetical protein